MFVSARCPLLFCLVSEFEYRFMYCVLMHLANVEIFLCISRGVLMSLMQ